MSNYIDITPATPGFAAKLVKNRRVVNSLPSSDHRAIEITLRWNVTEPAQPNRKPRFNTKKAKWEKFKRELRSAEDRACNENVSTSAEALAEIMQTRIINTSEKAIPRKQMRNSKIPGWNEEISKLKKGFNKAKRKRRDFRLRRKTYKDELTKSRLESWRKFVTEVENENPWGIPYKSALGRLLGGTAHIH